MGGKVAIALGLVAGVLVGGLLVAGAVALVPSPVPPPAEAPVATAPASPPATPAPSVAPEPTSAPASGEGSPAVPADPSPSASPAAGGALAIGQPAPPLQLPTVGGGTVDLASLRGKPVWVYFTATSCLPCRDELPLMQDFAARYDEAGLVILLVDAGEDEAAVKGFLDELNVYLPAALDADGAVQAEWGIAAPPVHAWIDDEGIVRDIALESVGPDAMATGLQKILPDETVTP
jgi:cytochrome c biogenesis protein CcmG, thiol:disulfide interchange protein DsbE